MVWPNDTHSLSGFLRDHKAHLDRLAATGRPEVLTVDGKPRVVVQDAESYRRMVETLDSVETERIVRERLASLHRGEPGVPAEQVLADIRARLGIEAQ